MCGGLTLAGRQVPIKLFYCSLFPAGQGRENKIESNSWIEIKQFAKAKAKAGCVHKEEKNRFVLYFSSASQCVATSWEAGLQHV